MGLAGSDTICGEAGSFSATLGHIIYSTEHGLEKGGRNSHVIDCDGRQSRYAAEGWEVPESTVGRMYAESSVLWQPSLYGRVMAAFCGSVQCVYNETKAGK
jgi:hypothetical protein